MQLAHSVSDEYFLLYLVFKCYFYKKKGSVLVLFKDSSELLKKVKHYRIIQWNLSASKSVSKQWSSAVMS